MKITNINIEVYYYTPNGAIVGTLDFVPEGTIRAMIVQKIHYNLGGKDGFIAHESSLYVGRRANLEDNPYLTKERIEDLRRSGYDRQVYFSDGKTTFVREGDDIYPTYEELVQAIAVINAEAKLYSENKPELNETTFTR